MASIGFFVNESRVEREFELFRAGVARLMTHLELSNWVFSRPKDHQVCFNFVDQSWRSTTGRISNLLLDLINELSGHELGAEVLFCHRIRRIGETKGALEWIIFVEARDDRRDRDYTTGVRHRRLWWLLKVYRCGFSELFVRISVRESSTEGCAQVSICCHITCLNLELIAGDIDMHIGRRHCL